MSLNQAASALCSCESALGWLSLVLPACLLAFVALEGYPRYVSNSLGNKLLLTQTNKNTADEMGKGEQWGRG